MTDERRETRAAMGAVTAVATFSMPTPPHFAAGVLVAEEAGATATDEQGALWTLQPAAYLVAATPALHADLLALVRQALVATEVE